MHQLYKTNTKRWPLNKSFFFLTAAAVLSLPAMAGTYTVTLTTDGHATNQFRGAIEAANAAGGSNTINVSAGTYTLTLGTIPVGNTSGTNITITGTSGAGSTIISMTTGAARDRIFNIDPNYIDNIKVTLTGLTLRNGYLTSTDYLGGGAILAGGPSNNALTITSCVFDSNTLPASAGTRGGAIEMQGGGALSIDQCTFTNNTALNNSGGAIDYYLQNNGGGGSVSITNSLFSNNSVSGGSVFSGGAIQIRTQVNAPGPFTCVVQKNTFLNNSVTTTSGVGGAIYIENDINTSTTYFINYNRFVGNTATVSSTSALGVGTSNGNAAVTEGNVDATNNWWGCNGGPTGCNDKAASSNGLYNGTFTATPYLQLTSSASPSTICSAAPGNTSTITASVLKNSAGNILLASNLTALAGLPVTFNVSPTLGTISGAQATIQPNGTATATFTSNGTPGTANINPVVDNVPASDATARSSVLVNATPSVTAQPASNSTACNGNTVTFSVTATNATAYQWYKGATALTNGVTGTGSTVSGATTSTLTITNASASDNAANYNVVITGGGTCQTTSNNVSLTVAALSLATATATGTGTVSSTNTVINDASCKRIATVLPSGASPVSGSVTAKATVDASQPSYNGQPYVIRHYDVTPATSPNTATATLTLYFLQSEFDAYNAARPGTANDLPTGPSDASGKANLRVTQYHGTGSAPGNYTGWGGSGPATVLITPGASNVVWNSTASWWEVTFSVTGFSGFYVTGALLSPLPIKLESFTATRQQNSVLLAWRVTDEINVAHYVIERSTDGNTFSAVGTVAATRSGSYGLPDNAPAAGTNYYRLKTVDADGRIAYSNVVTVVIKNNGFNVQLMPNPFRDKLVVYVEAEEAANTVFVLTDVSGRTVLQQSKTVTKGVNVVTLTPAVDLAKGTYLLNVVNGKTRQTLKAVKAGQ